MPAPRIPASGPGRRAVLRTVAGAGTIGAVLAVSGCRLRVGSPGSKTTPEPTAPTPTPDELALSRAAARAGALSSQYADAARIRPDLAAGLRQLGADHAAHLQAIRAAAPAAAGSPAGASSSPTSSSATTPGAPALTAASAISVLSQAERSSVAAALGDLTPLSPDAARLLASIAACSASHVTVLTRLAAPARRTTSVGTSTNQPS